MNNTIENSLGKWAGTYQVSVKWHGDHYNPVVISTDGLLTIQGTEVANYTYDSNAKRLSFDHTLIGQGEPKVDIQFLEMEGKKMFRGSIWTTRPSGPLDYCSHKYSKE